MVALVLAVGSPVEAAGPAELHPRSPEILGEHPAELVVAHLTHERGVAAETRNTGYLDHRLPGNFVPMHYEIKMTPAIADASFAGSVMINLRIVETTRELVCNAAKPEIVEATLHRRGRQL